MQTFTPEQYLKIDIASNFGLEKEDWDVRIKWFDENEHRLLDLLDEAEEPALFYAGVQAWNNTRMGHAISYPISLDATASGAQLLAILVGCRKSAELCNVVDTGRREDFYTNIYEFMLQELDDESKITRTMAKEAIMPSFYGSEAKPKEVFGEGALLDCFYNTMNERAPGLWELNQDLLGLWQADAVSHDWVLPDNFHVKIKTMDTMSENVHFLNQPFEVTYKVNQAVEKGRHIPANLVHSIDGMIVREMLRRCSFDRDQLLKVMKAIMEPSDRVSIDRDDDEMVQLLWSHYQESGFLSARILDHLDAYNIGLVDANVIEALIVSMPKEPFPVITVHDCFRVHPNNGNDLRQQYNQILSDLAKSDILKNTAEQITGTAAAVQKYDDLSAEILQANYALS